MNPHKKPSRHTFEFILHEGKIIKVIIKEPLTKCSRILAHTALKYSYKFN